MKRFLALVLGVIFVLGFTAYASAEVTLGGRILVRGWYFDNISGSLPVKAESQATYTTNVFITVDAKVAENVRGFLELETSPEDSTTGITSRTSGIYYWGSQDQKAAADMYFRQAWIHYTGSGLLGVPAGIKAGHMLLTLGEKQFLNHERFGDDAILLTVEPTKELLIGLLTAKLNEGTTSIHRDDIDAYVLLGTYKLDKGNTVGLNYTLIHSDALAGATSPYASTVDFLDFQNLGLHANGKVQGLTYAAEVDAQFGKIDGLGATADTKFRGYGIFAKLDYKVDPVTLRASFAMGSGDSDTTDNKNKEFQALVGSTGDASGAIARFVHYTQVYERAIRTAANGQAITGNTRTTGIANTTYYNAGLDLTPTKDVSVSLDGYILRATKAWQAGQSKNVGTEVDAKVSYKLAKNLTYFVEAGVFSPGKFYTTPGIGLTEKKTATLLVHGLNLTF